MGVEAISCADNAPLLTKLNCLDALAGVIRYVPSNT
jgi:hypothetical protein